MLPVSASDSDADAGAVTMAGALLEGGADEDGLLLLLQAARVMAAAEVSVNTASARPSARPEPRRPVARCGAGSFIATR